ncbi:broad-complex core protein isoforms 1/2/3/4/5 [Culicoides brevitarsis]|uniref:broad-complex core protein isoforms 1/2/3/4/5 n=1 Tax=Culicoides brevitarsis TaxID=469753 RepID=UPI00307B51A4
MPQPNININNNSNSNNNCQSIRYCWEADKVKTLIRLRAELSPLFTGKRNASKYAWAVVERELNVPLPISKIIKKWNNLLQEYKAIKMSEEPKRREWPFFTLMDVYFSDQVNDPTLRLFSSTKRFDTDTLDDTNFEEELKYLPPAAANALAAYNANAELRALAAQNAANAAAAAQAAANGNGNGMMNDMMDDNQSDKGEETSSFDEPEITINTHFPEAKRGSMENNNNHNEYDDMPENRYERHVNQKILQQMSEHHNIDQYLLSWRGFHGNMCKGFHTLQRDGQMVDVTIAAGGKIFKAHKLVLSVCSPYFQKIFLEHPSQHPILFMTDVNSQHMAGLLDFMYSGQVNVKYEDLQNFLKVAEALQVKGLHGESTSDNADPERERRESMDSAYQKQQQQMAEQFRQTNQLYQQIQRNIANQQSAMQQRNNIREHIRVKPTGLTEDYNNANNNNNNNNPNVNNNNLNLQNKMAQYALHQMNVSNKMLEPFKHQKYYSKRKLINQYEKEQMQEQKRNRTHSNNNNNNEDKNYNKIDDGGNGNGSARDSPCGTPNHAPTPPTNHIKAEPTYDMDDDNDSGTDGGLNYATARTPPGSNGANVNNIAEKIRHSLLEPNIVLHQQGEDMLTSAKATLNNNKPMAATS